MRACPSCGHGNEDTSKFCPECGTALLPVSERREERKVVSVVFVDLVGSTARAETSDPEDVRALLRTYHERARDELESFGGTVEKFIGDAVVAVFGAPTTHEDDPERAVRAALAVRDAVAQMNEDEPDRDLHVRIAVNTGEALVSLDASPGEGEGMVAGDVVNTAARLQSAAPVDGILVGAQTYRATERQIAYRPVEPVEAKGKAEPVSAWEAVEARSRFGVDIGGAGRAELVGRAAELDVLVDALTRSRRERSTQLVTLVGVPGIGKSRLVYELSRVVDEDEELISWRQGRSLPYGEGVSFWALGEVVKAQAGILESDPGEAAQAKLADAAALLDDAEEREWVERHLRPLVGLGSDEVSVGDRRGEAFAAWRRFLEAVSERGPTVLVFEDLHWADDGLLDFVDGLVDWVDGVPLLVVCTARPELLDRRPGWGGGKRNAVTVSLTPLDEEATARLVLALLDRPVLDARTQQALVERSAGNPLYAEEFVRMVEAGGAADERLPESVQGIVAARIDLLPPAEKELLRNAAVLGKVFWSDALLALGGSDEWQLKETLRSLERKEFVRREHRSAVAGATQYAFVHALVRDTAYAQLPRAARARLHLAVADWIESLPEDRAEDRAETLAHHYLTAIELVRAAGDDVEELGRRAVRVLHEAGERALALSSFHAAARFLAHALELLPGDEPPSAELLFAAGAAFGFVGRLGDELARAVDAFEAAGDPERAAEAAIMHSWHDWHGGSAVSPWIARAASLLEGRPASRAKALVLAEQARLAMVGFQYSTGSELALVAERLAREIGDTAIEADALITRGACAASEGDEAGIAEIERGLELVGHRGRLASRGYVNLGVAWGVFGDHRQARAVTERGIERAEREGDEQGAWFLRGNLMGYYGTAGEWDKTTQLVEAFIAERERFGYMEPAARSIHAVILAARDDGAGALAEVRKGLEVARRIDDPQTIWPTLSALAHVARLCGLTEERDRALDELLAEIRASRSVGDAQDFHVETALELVLADRAEDAALLVELSPETPWRRVVSSVVGRDYVAAADQLEAIGEQPLQAELRLNAARALARAGRLAEAEEHLERARAFWRRVGAAAFLREAEDVLGLAS